MKIERVKILNDLSWHCGSRLVSKGEYFDAVKVIGGFLIFNDGAYVFICNHDIEVLPTVEHTKNISGGISLLSAIGDKPKSINIKF